LPSVRGNIFMTYSLVDQLVRTLSRRHCFHDCVEALIEKIHVLS